MEFENGNMVGVASKKFGGKGILLLDVEVNLM
jgi:hypothetical protein